MRHFYKVTDFDGYDSYLTSKRNSISLAKRYWKEAKELGYVDPPVTLCQFDLPKLPLRKLVLLLLHGYNFMQNAMYVDFMDVKH